MEKVVGLAVHFRCGRCGPRSLECFRDDERRQLEYSSEQDAIPFGRGIHSPLSFGLPHFRLL